MTRDKLQATGDTRAMTPSWHHPETYWMRLVACPLSLVAMLLLSGCLHRSLTIRTDPPGALVYINDELKGQTPLSYDFVWYGWHRVMIRKDGYERVEDHKLLRAPVYLWIPFDFFAELAPFPIRDLRTWSYALTPLNPLPTPMAPPLNILPAPQSNTRTLEQRPAAEQTGTTPSPATPAAESSGIEATRPSISSTPQGENTTATPQTEPAATAPTTETTHDAR